MRHSIHVLASRALSLVALALPASADAFVVHPTPGAGDFVSVADALSSPLVVDGDHLWVHPGTYSGPFVLTEKLVLEALAGPATTILDGGGLAPVVAISGGATLVGFTITGGDGDFTYGGVHVTGTERAELRDCVVEDNHPTGDVGIPAGGIGVGMSAKLRMHGCTVRGNSSLSVGGMFAGPLAEVDLVSCHFAGNGGPGTPTGGMLLGASARLVNCRITGNLGSGIGGFYFAGGIGPVPAGAVLEMHSTTIYGNLATAPIGAVGGVYLEDGGDVTIVNTIVYENTGATVDNFAVSSDFFPPPSPAVLDLSYSHVESFGPGVPPGLFMLPGFVPPAFVAPVSAIPGMPASGGDFHLLPGSLDVDAGLASAFPEDAAAGDLGGVLRVLGASIDLGAYETGTSCTAPIYFGTGKESSLAMTPWLSTTGEPSVSGAGLDLHLHDALPHTLALRFTGPRKTYTPYLGGTLYVKPDLRHVGLSRTDASGALDLALPLDPSLAGETRYHQLFFRDPLHLDGTGAGLSNAVQVDYCF